MAIDCPHGYRDDKLCPACHPIVWGGPDETDSAEPLAVTLARIEMKLDTILALEDHREELANLRYLVERYQEDIAELQEKKEE